MNKNWKETRVHIHSPQKKTNLGLFIILYISTRVDQFRFMGVKYGVLVLLLKKKQKELP